MAEKFQNKYRIPSARLQGYDYGANGAYYVTICTRNRVCFFGEIVETGNCPSQSNFHNHMGTDNQSGADIHPGTDTHPETDNYPSLRPTDIGQIAIDFWNEIPNHYPFVELDEFVVMPNHIHGILFFNKPDKNDWKPNQFGPQSQNLGAVIRAYKSSVKRYANQNNIEFGWQSRFHDHIIRDGRALNAIRQYIITNPENWLLDVLYTKTNNVKTGNCPSEKTDHNHVETDNRPSEKTGHNHVETDNYPSLRETIENELKNILKSNNP